MTLNTRQVSFYMAQRNKGLTQEAAAATTGISVRSGRVLGDNYPVRIATITLACL
ncbi:hypothetical protein [Klebsiella pneumoniae]|uniref:hypothetical protein n=1 Tax=Klebsiella pneumoniae TaxID=573 RepID=UPI00237F7D8F|nr:hypothetical protein [Klebsiella pneumoniae]